jgi:lipid II:glycine glycyltransferase (peptidoglycan interpeptide bridge formation enzyme)
LGVQYYIFGGYRPNLSKDKSLYSVQKFKLEMGGEVEYGYHFIKVIKPSKYVIFKIALKIKSILSGKNLSILNLDGLEIKRS